LHTAFGQSLLEAMSATYVDWRNANARKCQAKDVANALLYFLGGSLAEMGVASNLPEKGQWETFVRDTQRTLGEVMAFCRAQMEAHQGSQRDLASRWEPERGGA
jgi:hypothetical protein